MAGKDRPLVVLPDRSRDEPAGWGVLEVGQVMKMVAGADGKPCYTLIEQIKFEG